MNRDTVLPIATAPRRDSKHWTNGTVSWGDLLKWAEAPGTRKEAGNYLLGELRGSVRSATSVITRSAITLDVDHPAPGFLEGFLALADYEALVHSTYSSTPDDLRYRIIIPTDRAMAPDEYHCAAQALMDRYGPTQFDPSCARPSQYMFKPGTPNRDWYRWWHNEGHPIRVDSLLADFDEDLSDRPVPSIRKRDPFTLEGVVGAFNRAYEDFSVLISEYDLPYEADGDRWKLVDARSMAGMGKVADGLVYSHHSHDPAAGVTCTAFDLVRLHRFGELDEDQSDQTPINRRKSYAAMLDLATVDPRVTAEIVGVDFAATLEDEDAEDAEGGGDLWKMRLKLRPRTGDFLDCIYNWDLVQDNDPTFAGLYYNELTMATETDSDLPWRSLEQGGRPFTTPDQMALAHYLEREYGVRPPRFLVDELVTTTSRRRWVNPVKDYLLSLTWDGVPRVEECLPGVIPDDYTRVVARKSLVAAAARVLDPGCKWDHTLIMFGKEDLGKSWWVDKLARGFTAPLGRIGDKDTLLAMHRSWIMTSDEGFSLRKADSDVLKEFLTRREDVFRMPYDRETMAHPRRCVIWGTTNDEVFLRRQEGNRRFMIVHCVNPVDFAKVTEEYVDQLWAEAVHLYRAGEKLFFDREEKAQAAVERERFTEEDNLTGLIEKYLETLVPDNWDDTAPESRFRWLQDRENNFTPPGKNPINRVCSWSIWVEVLGNRVGDRGNTKELRDISTALKKMEGWTVLPGRHRGPYGPQLTFVRTDSMGFDLL